MDEKVKKNHASPVIMKNILILYKKILDKNRLSLENWMNALFKKWKTKEKGKKVKLF